MADTGSVRAVQRDPLRSRRAPVRGAALHPRPLRDTARAGSRSGTSCSWSSTSSRTVGCRCRSPSVDTGLGLERLASVLQQVPTNYDTDLFTPIHARMRELLGHDPEAFESERFSYQVIADHSRAVTFLIADDVLPSNEGRGYVLRKLLRRAVRHGRLLGRREPFMAETAAVVIDVMGEAYPHLVDAARRDPRRRSPARRRSSRGRSTPGTNQLEAAIAKLGRDARPSRRPPPRGPPGRRAAAARRHRVPAPRHVRLPDRPDRRARRRVRRRRRPRRVRARPRRAARAEPLRDEGPALADTPSIAALYGAIQARAGDTEFLGYETTTAEGRVVAIVRDGMEFDELTGHGEAEVVLDRTPFYAEGGGQVGDQGVLREPGGGSELFTVTDTQKPLGGLIVHRGTLHGRLRVGETVEAVVDADRRADTMRNHTGTHLLHRALRNVVGERARQAGSLVTPDYLRFDFPFDRGLTDDELRAIEDEVRRIIRDDRPVSIAFMTHGRGDRGRRGRLLRREVRRDGPDDPRPGLQLRAVRRHALPGHRPDRRLRHHRRAQHRLGDAPHRGRHRAPAADALVRERFDALERAAAAVGAQSIDDVADRIAALQDELRETKRRLKAGGGGRHPEARRARRRARSRSRRASGSSPRPLPVRLDGRAQGGGARRQRRARLRRRRARRSMPTSRSCS